MNCLLFPQINLEVEHLYSNEGSNLLWKWRHTYRPAIINLATIESVPIPGMEEGKSDTVSVSKYKFGIVIKGEWNPDF